MDVEVLEKLQTEAFKYNMITDPDIRDFMIEVQNKLKADWPYLLDYPHTPTDTQTNTLDW